MRFEIKKACFHHSLAELESTLKYRKRDRMIANKSLAQAYKKRNTELILFIYSQAVEQFLEFLCEYKLFFNWQRTEHRFLDFIIFKLVLDGYTTTYKSYNYLQDLMTRLAQLDLKREIIAKIDYKDIYCENYDAKFRDFGNLPSVQQQKNLFYGDRVANDHDPYFWYMKHYIEYLIKTRISHPLSYYKLMLDEAIKRFPLKDFSTLKAKAKSIFRYYEKRDFKIFEKYERKLNDKELAMTRSENMKRVKELQKMKTRAFIKELISNENLFENEFIHSEGQYKGLVNVEKLSNYTKISKITIRKHLKEMGIR